MRKMMNRLMLFILSTVMVFGGSLAYFQTDYACAEPGEFNKAAPTITVPEASAVYGQTLSDVELTNPEGNTPGTWIWDKKDQSVGDAGEKSFDAFFMPDDAKNYLGVKKSVKVTVKKAPNPAVIEKNVQVKAGRDSVDLSGHVHDAKGVVSYNMGGSEPSSCHLEGSTLQYDSGGDTVKVMVFAWGDENYEPLSDPAEITVYITNKDEQKISAEDVTATYGDTDKKVIATVTEPSEDGGTITYEVEPNSEPYIEVDKNTGVLSIIKVPASGTAYVIARAPEVTGYDNATKYVTISINKAVPTAKAPELTATYGDTLADLTLTDPKENTEGTWTWSKSMFKGEGDTFSLTDVGDAGVHNDDFKADFTPTDKTDYKCLTGVPVKITVAKAEPAIVEKKVFVEKGGNTVDLSNIVHKFGTTGEVSYAFDGETNDCSLNGSVLTTGDKAGSVIVKVSIAEDKNYKAKQVAVTVIIEEGEESENTDDPSPKPAPETPGGNAIKAYNNGYMAPGDTTVLTNKGKKYYLITDKDCQITVVKGNKFFISDPDGRAEFDKQNKKFLSISKKGKVSAKKAAEDLHFSFNNKKTGKKITVSVNIIEPTVENNKKLKAQTKAGETFDFSTTIPLNTVFGKVKNKGVAEGLIYSGAEAIGTDGNLHIKGTALKKGKITIPFTVYGKKFKAVITVKK